VEEQRSPASNYTPCQKPCIVSSSANASILFSETHYPMERILLSTPGGSKIRRVRSTSPWVTKLFFHVSILSL